MSAKQPEIQQELFGTIKNDDALASDGVKENQDLKLTEIIDSSGQLELVDTLENILVVKEEKPKTQIEAQGKPVKGGLGFEQGVGRLEQIIASLEQKDIPLEQALALFREGVELVQACNRMLDQAEAQMQILLEGPDGGLKLEKANLQP